MPRYYVNMLMQPDGLHEVHKAGCDRFPNFEDVLPLGEFTDIEYAVREAAKTFPQSAPCKHCSRVGVLSKTAHA